MDKVLVIVDMQNDFIDGSLGSKEAQAIVPNVVNKIKAWDGDIIFTRDTHTEDYMSTQEGKNLPVEHCIKDTDGWEIADIIKQVVKEKYAGGQQCAMIFDKPSFGSLDLAYFVSGKYKEIELVGLCTDICVVSNALLLKTFDRGGDTIISVDASCCAGVTPDKHKAALETMKSCQINVIGE